MPSLSEAATAAREAENRRRSGSAASRVVQPEWTSRMQARVDALASRHSSTIRAEQEELQRREQLQAQQYYEQQRMRERLHRERDAIAERERQNSRRPATTSSANAASSSNVAKEPQPVYLLNCKSCGNFISDRGMRAVLLLRPHVTLFSTDIMPTTCGPLHAPSRANFVAGTEPYHETLRAANREPTVERTCDCLTQTLGCYGCGAQVGYHIIQPCAKCTASQTDAQRGSNGHRVVLHCSEISVRERRYVPGEKGVLCAPVPEPSFGNKRPERSSRRSPGRTSPRSSATSSQSSTVHPSTPTIPISQQLQRSIREAASWTYSSSFDLSGHPYLDARRLRMVEIDADPPTHVHGNSSQVFHHQEGEFPLTMAEYMRLDGYVDAALMDETLVNGDYEHEDDDDDDMEDAFDRTKVEDFPLAPAMTAGNGSYTTTAAASSSPYWTQYVDAARTSSTTTTLSKPHHHQEAKRILQRGDVVYWTDLVKGGERAEPFDPEIKLQMPIAGR